VLLDIRASPPSPGVVEELRKPCRPLARAAGGKGPCMSETNVSREINAGELQRHAIEQVKSGEALLNWLSLLERDGYVAKRRSMLLSGAHKIGKSELLQQVVEGWRGDTVLWFTEEGIGDGGPWAVRLANRPEGCFDHVGLVWAPGLGKEEMLARIAAGDEQIIVIDTLRTLLQLESESDNAEVAAALMPFVTVCNERGKTLTAIHLDRKSGGAYGEGVSGAAAFVGVVDTVLQITRDSGKPQSRRVISGLARNYQIDDLLYERQADGTMVALGSPKAVTVPEVRERCLDYLRTQPPGAWATLKEIREGMSEPPSSDQVREALYQLALPDTDDEGISLPKVETDPPIYGPDGRRQKIAGKTLRFRLVAGAADNPTSDLREGGVEGPGATARERQMGREPNGNEAVEATLDAQNLRSKDRLARDGGSSRAKATLDATLAEGGVEGAEVEADLEVHICWDCNAPFPCTCGEGRRPHTCRECVEVRAGDG
jgi:hypothetical protein